MICPSGDGKHQTDNPPKMCSDCEDFWDQQRAEWEADQMLAFPAWVRGEAPLPMVDEIKKMYEGEINLR